jgi:putative effector of murein hydrolase LrgA (UPF0299 family)
MRWNPFDWLIKWILILLFVPPLVSILLQILAARLAQTLPILIVVAVVVGLVAGVSRAAIGRRPRMTRGSGYGAPNRAPFSDRGNRKQDWW